MLISSNLIDIKHSVYPEIIKKQHQISQTVDFSRLLGLLVGKKGAEMPLGLKD